MISFPFNLAVVVLCLGWVFFVFFKLNKLCVYVYGWMDRQIAVALKTLFLSTVFFQLAML